MSKLSVSSAFIKNLLRQLPLVLALFFLVGTQTTYALSDAQIRAIQSGVYYFNTEESASSGSCAGGGIPASGGIADFLAQWELEESGGGGGEFNPFNYVVGPGTDYNSVGVKNYPDYQTGITETVAFFNQSNMSAVLSGLQSGNVQTAAQALDAFYASWGGPAMGSKVVSDMKGVDLTRTIPSMPGHSIGDFAQDLLKALSSGSASAPGSASASSDSCTGSSSGGFSGSGDSSKYYGVLDCPTDPGWVCSRTVHFTQWLGPWTNDTFYPGCGTVAQCGCGLTSTAMAIDTLNNITSVTPETLLPDWQDGLASAGGTTWNASAWAALGQKYGIQINPVFSGHSPGMTDAEIQKIISALQGGALVGVSGQDPNGANANDPFTSGGHFILIRGYNASTKMFLIADPNDSFSNPQSSVKEWGWDIFQNYGESAWAYSK